MAYIDEHVGVRHEDADGPGLRWGVESICAQLTELGAKIAPATYYEHRGRKPTAREQRDTCVQVSGRWWFFLSQKDQIEQSTWQ